ncbi:CobW-like nucleotide-binding protein (plasmid) [Octadecabacter arcticus 238]|jgi:G3E family GTPase|uniref:CobW-like nucleotide-binding protein n=1 Tax=Octadecabacter arcticus 238 TaxID=391616 RepID=M9RTA0_9RHOB|nr:CobW family GTP-binding protein [Octadecabacter arcticus]AGI74938.1 CobW-like nucleotide-binding protein [Octadecabacter arcticus 238]
MSVPILLITGFLGAGKTTLINRLLGADHGRRIAAIVNDFGAINIDADILSGSAEGIIGLKNGCICCSLQGDLLRTIKLLLTQDPVPELIVIEASGVADPAGIVQSLMDPVIGLQASLGSIVCVVDAPDAATRGADPLWQAQVRAADMICLSKTGETDPDALVSLQTRLAVEQRRYGFDMDAPLPLAVLLEAGPTADRPRDTIRAPLRDDRFVHLEWTHSGAVDMRAFQDLIGHLAPDLLRAKGFLTFQGRTGCMLFQLAGQRATLAPAQDPHRTGCALVLIGEHGTFDPDAAHADLDRLSPDNS